MKTRFFIALVVVSIIVFGFAVGYFYLWQYQISPLLERFSDTQKDIQVVTVKNESFQKVIVGDLKKYTDLYNGVHDLFFNYNRDRGYGFILFVEEAAKRNNLTHSFSAAPSAISPVVSIAVSGAYQDVIKFLREIENEKFLIHINSILMQGGSAISVSMSLKLQSL